MATAATMPTDAKSEPTANSQMLASTVEARTSSQTQTAGSSGDGSQASPPDLSNELATLNNKLIDAINHQAKLDDTLAATRADLDAARKKIHSLEAQGQNYSDMIAKGVLVKKADTEGERLRLLAKLEEEIRMKDAAEKGRKGIEQELESLTAALFEEANKMVAAARKDREAAERKNEQLRSQIKDMEVLLASHQEQLAELKTVMQQMSSDRDETETTANASTAPSTPALGNQDGFGKNFESLGLAPNHSAMEDVPAQPLSFPHLLHPVLRTDLQAYDDFHALLQISKTAPPSRASSGSYGSLNVMGLRNLAAQASSTSSAGNNPNSPSATPSSVGPQHLSSSTPATPVSAGTSHLSLKDGPLQLVSLKETPFYKRALVEDVEPTLRLETAPGLSWLARRTVVNSMTDGSLVVEPIPSAAKRYPFTCALCGESRKGDEYARTHRFRVSENESAQRYPLCTFCLARVRVTCDFVGFLRMVRDGHWRAVGEEGEKAAWEECVRLRERMFWTRIGGGVVPAFVQVKDSIRDSMSGGKMTMKLDRPSASGAAEGEDHLLPRPSQDHGSGDIAPSIGDRSCQSSASPAEGYPVPSLEDLESSNGKYFESESDRGVSKDNVEIEDTTGTVNYRPPSIGEDPESPSRESQNVESAPRNKEISLSISIPGAFNS